LLLSLLILGGEEGTKMPKRWLVNFFLGIT